MDLGLASFLITSFRVESCIMWKLRLRKVVSVLSIGGTLTLGACGGNSSPHGGLSPLTAGNSPLAPLPKIVAEPYAGVDLRDVAQYQAPHATEAKTIIAAMTHTPADFFPQNVHFSKSGPTLALDSQRNKVYGVEFVTMETTDSSKHVTINSLFHSDSNGFVFRTHQLTLSTDGTQISQIQIVRDLPISQTHFTMKLGVMQRKIILSDAEHGIVKIYPVGVGGFDFGVLKKGAVSALTPKYKIASVERSAAIYSRDFPAYYAGRPFVRVSNGDGNYTELGFHYSITPKLERGFVSHGCVRVRDKDLYELYYIVLGSGDTSIPLEIRYWLKEKTDHPFPLDDSKYEEVKNFGTADDPESRRDREDLTILEETSGTPPADNFTDNLIGLMNLQ